MASYESEQKHEDQDHENEDQEEEVDGEEEEQEKSYMDISELEQMKISSTDIKKLKDANFFTVESIAYTPKKQLGEIKGISDNKVEKIQEAGIYIHNPSYHQYVTYLILRTYTD